MSKYYRRVVLQPNPKIALRQRMLVGRPTLLEAVAVAILSKVIIFNVDSPAYEHPMLYAAIFSITKFSTMIWTCFHFVKQYFEHKD